MKIKIIGEVRILLETLDQYGGKSYLIGGAVRDLLMRKEPVDYDIATTLLPDETAIACSRWATDIKDREYGTVRVMINRKRYEITTLRREGDYVDSRHPQKIVFTDRIEEDLRRRDFTVNALAVDKEGEVVNFCDGIKDLKKRRLRTVGDPKRKLEEDALRIWRGLALIAGDNFKPDEETEKAMKKADLVINLNRIAPGVLGREAEKIIGGSYFWVVLREYRESIAPVLSVFSPSNFNPDLIRIFESKNIKTDILKWALIYYHCPELTDELFKIGMSFKKVSEIGKLIRAGEILEATPADQRKRAVVAKPKLFSEAVLSEAIELIGLRRGKDKSLRDLKKECLFISQLRIKGDDLIKLGVKEGKEIKDLLEKALSLVISGKLANKRKIIINHFKKNGDF